MSDTTANHERSGTWVSDKTKRLSSPTTSYSLTLTPAVMTRHTSCETFICCDAVSACRNGARVRAPGTRCDRWPGGTCSAAALPAARSETAACCCNNKTRCCDEKTCRCPAAAPPATTPGQSVGSRGSGGTDEPSKRRGGGGRVSTTSDQIGSIRPAFRCLPSQLGVE